jgi:TonB family protein
MLGPTLVLLEPAVLNAQEQPLAAGSDGVPIPKKQKHVQPVYPQEALEQGLRGIVILDLVIDTEGRVAEMHIIRSIPGLDEAALAAARQWRYEPVKVDGRPVSVRVTVPITFALKLPEVTRDRGIPEIRQGVTPVWPDDSRGGGRAAADVTLDPDGRIGLARIIEGEEPWSGSLLEALRTWRFRAPPEDTNLSFRVDAEFVPGSGRDQGVVKLQLSGLREVALFDAWEEPADVAALEPAGRPGEPAGTRSDQSPEEPEPPAPGTAEAEPQAPTPSEGPEPPAPEAEPGPEEPAAAPGLPAQATESVSEPIATPVPQSEGTAPPAAPGSPPAAAPPPAATAARESAVAASAPAPETAAADDPTAPPPIEVLRALPPPPPPENGISAIRGVLLEPGVPDLTRGRRPVSPPFARMAGTSGVVEVNFSVSAGGIPSVQDVDGPEVLKPAATQAVESWIFRRTRADRAYLTAVFTYEDDLASAVVRPQPAP